MKYEINYSPTWIIAEFVFCHCTCITGMLKFLMIKYNEKEKYITLSVQF
jgi:hypothetical protein